MYAAQLAVAIFLGALSLFIIAGNWYIAVRWFVRKQSESTVPFIGGLLGALAVAVSPIKSLQAWWWAPLLVDVGGVTGFAAGIACVAIRWCKARFSDD